MSFPVDASKSVVLDSSGNGTVKVGPTNSGQAWKITRASVQVSSNTKEPTANLWLGNKTKFISGTYTGSNDTDGDLNEMLGGNGYIMCIWTGGDAGATATLTIAGTQEQ